MLPKQAESKASELHIVNSIDPNSSTMTTQVKKPDPDDYKDTIQVGLRLRIEQLSAVNTVSQSYRARMIQVTDWLATEEDIEEFKKAGEDFRPSRITKPLWLNCISENVIYDVYSQFEMEDSDGKMLTYNLRMVYLDSEFTEEFECGNFPFDVQDLSFILDGEMGVDKAIFVPSRHKDDLFYINTSFLALCDWEIVHSVCVKNIYIIVHVVHCTLCAK